jgi:uncharacterized repeat protein (TIGR03803 family)
MRIPLLIAFIAMLALSAGTADAAATAVRPSNTAAAATASSPTFNVLYNFTGGADGAEPNGGLAVAHGMLFGTTARAGILPLCGGFGCGTVFTVTSGGREMTLHDFGSQPDGQGPSGELLLRRGTLYGTTGLGGTAGAGTVFTTQPSGTHVLYSFAGGSDGAVPDGGLVETGGVLYGTTTSGGSHGNGTIFAITASGRERVLYRFPGGSTGDASPFGLIFGGGEFYVITTGLIVGVDPAGNARVVHRVSAPYFPLSLVYDKGLIYGVTLGGGRGCRGGGCGTIFALTPAGNYRTLYAFAGGRDGAAPSSLIVAGGTFYGTTANGGGSGCGGFGCGTVFSFDPATGTETVLHRFQLQTDGGGPGSVNALNGVLYGTTSIGGTGTCSYDPLGGCGTVFALTP